MFTFSISPLECYIVHLGATGYPEMPLLFAHGTVGMWSLMSERPEHASGMATIQTASHMHRAISTPWYWYWRTRCGLICLHQHHATPRVTQFSCIKTPYLSLLEKWGMFYKGCLGSLEPLRVNDDARWLVAAPCRDCNRWCWLLFHNTSRRGRYVFSLFSFGDPAAVLCLLSF